MELSEKNAMILMIDIHQDIEEFADYSVTKLLDDKQMDFIVYPPNCELSNAEIKALNELGNDPDLKSGLKKIMANNSAEVLFSLFNIIDGTGHPKNDDRNEWKDLKLVDEEWDEARKPVDDWLHDKFFDTYWDWKEKMGRI